ncbi:thermonuclease family protein [Chloroflexota bacterium]
MWRPLLVLIIILSLLVGIVGCLTMETPTLRTIPATPSGDSPPAITISTPTSRESAIVVDVIDGDTIGVDINGSIYRVRYIGIDTPERGQEGYEEATLANAELVSGKVVDLEKDVSETDKYGRLLRYVWTEEGMVNAVLVESGYAQVSTYPPDVKYQEEFLELQRIAEQTGTGLWAAPRPSPHPLPQGEILYVGSTKSDKYHYRWCRYVEQIKRENFIGFSSVAEAQAMGYVPCKVCNPPLKD